MNTERRIDLLANLGAYLDLNDLGWQEAQARAVGANPWFTPEHVTLAIQNIRSCYLDKAMLLQWLSVYRLPRAVKTVGIVMAGNIPLVGFHDFLCGFLSGHRIMLKLSSKDSILLAYLLAKLTEWEPETGEQVLIAERLTNCDAFIATGSNNTARYFEQYFAKYPHLIRKNRTSVAILDGTETDGELELLAGDVYTYFGLGCRNVTQLCVPQDYDFERLLRIFGKYDRYADMHKYKNNYDYHLAIYLLNKVKYMSNSTLLLVENDLPFSAVSVLHYRYYSDKEALGTQLKASEDIQAIVGHGYVPFGHSQSPALADYADGIDTMAFLCNL